MHRAVGAQAAGARVGDCWAEIGGRATSVALPFLFLELAASQLQRHSGVSVMVAEVYLI